MFREDYIMRMIRQLSQVLTRVLFQKDSKQYQDALEEIRHNGKLFLGLDLNAIHTVTYDDLQEALRVRNAHDADHISLVAELLRHQGECFDFEGRPEAARQSYILALDLYLDLFAARQRARLADLTARIDLLLDRLDPLALDADAQIAVFRFFDAEGRYADAEDLLFHLADEHPTPELYAEGVAFFERLLGKSYRYLKAGNLPYEEVNEGLAAFRQKMEAGSSKTGGNPR